MRFKPLKYFILAENVIGIYRNYVILSKGSQKAICVRSLFEMLLLLSNMIINSHFYIFVVKTDLLYFYLATGNSFMVISMSLFYSRKFKILVSNFCDYYNYFGSDGEYTQKIERKQKLLLTAVVAITLIKLSIVFYQSVIKYLEEPGVHEFLFLFFQLNLAVCDLRYTFEYFVLYFILCVISEQLDEISRSVESELFVSESVSECLAVQLTLEQREHVPQFDKWSAAYTNIKESLKLCNNIFRIQVTMMLSTMLLYYVMLLYSITTLSVTGNFTTVRQVLYYFTLCVNLTALSMLSRGAQAAENSAIVLKRKLGILLLRSLGNEPCYRATNDLLRLVSSRPIRTQAFGSINVNMTLLPSCVAFITSYTVIALQFNNVV